MSETHALGEAVPALPHAISVSLPTWRDNVGYEEGEKRVVEAMSNGYPRFFIQKNIEKLAAICESRFGLGEEKCMLFPSAKIAEQCRAFMARREPSVGPYVRTVQFQIEPGPNADCGSGECMTLHIVLFPSAQFGLAKQFWQHTGLGVSSRFAERCLALLHINAENSKSTSAAPTRIKGKAGNRHYARKSSLSSPIEEIRPPEALTESHSTYLEERYGRNMPQSHGETAKRTLRRRIAGVLLYDPYDTLHLPRSALDQGRDLEEVMGPSTRGVRNLSEEDVFLFPTGMTAIWFAHQLVLATMEPHAKSICFGFPYTDTLKILQKWGPGCHHFGHGTTDDLESFASLLAESPPNSISALFVEFPSNPLLRSPDLRRLRELADKYDFLIVVDDTIGNFENVDVLPLADIVVSGLTKIFSGDANVMGGSLALNPEKKHYSALQKATLVIYEDSYFSEDAIYLERNSRDFARRIQQIDKNTELVASFLHSHIVEPPDGKPTTGVVKRVWYPLYETREFYENCRVHASSDGRRREGGYGGLLSVTFTSQAASQAFFDALECAKGPSLGTNFTLACPYTILAHYTELEWAQGWEVDKELVRISIGLEEPEELVGMIGRALRAAQDTARLVKSS